MEAAVAEGLKGARTEVAMVVVATVQRKPLIQPQCQSMKW